jgi:hypothetical protein
LISPEAIAFNIALKNIHNDIQTRWKNKALLIAFCHDEANFEVRDEVAFDVSKQFMIRLKEGYDAVLRGKVDSGLDPENEKQVKAAIVTYYSEK